MRYHIKREASLCLAEGDTYEVNVAAVSKSTQREGAVFFARRYYMMKTFAQIVVASVITYFILVHVLGIFPAASFAMLSNF